MYFEFDCTCGEHILDCTCTLSICSVGSCRYVGDSIKIANHLFTTHKDGCDAYKETKDRELHEIKCKCGNHGYHSHYVDNIDDISDQYAVCPHLPLKNTNFCRVCMTRNRGKHTGWKCVLCPEMDRVPESYPDAHFQTHMQPNPRPFCTLCEVVVEHNMAQTHEEKHYQKKKWCSYQFADACLVASSYLLPPCRYDKLNCMNHLGATKRLISKNTRPLMNIDFIRKHDVSIQLKTMGTSIQTILLLATITAPDAGTRLKNMVDAYIVHHGPSVDSETSYQRLPIDMWLTIGDFCDVSSRMELTRTCMLLRDLFTPTITHHDWLLDHFHTIAKQRSNKDVWWATDYTGVTKKDTKELFGFTDSDLRGILFNYMTNPWKKTYGDLCIYNLKTLATLAESKYTCVKGFEDYMKKRWDEAIARQRKKLV